MLQANKLLIGAASPLYVLLNILPRLLSNTSSHLFLGGLIVLVILESRRRIVKLIK